MQENIWSHSPSSPAHLETTSYVGAAGCCVARRRPRWTTHLVHSCENRRTPRDRNCTPVKDTLTWDAPASSFPKVNTSKRLQKQRLRWVEDAVRGNFPTDACYSAHLSGRCPSACTLPGDVELARELSYVLDPSARARAPQARLTVPCPVLEGPEGTVSPKPTLLLGASPDTSREWREATQPECPRGKSRRRKPFSSDSPTAPMESRDCTDLSPYLLRRLLSVRSAAPEAGSRVTGWLGAGGPLGFRLQDRGLHLQSRCVGNVPLFSSPWRAPSARRGLWVPAGVGTRPRSSFLWRRPVSPSPRSTPPRGPRQPPNRGRGWVPSSRTPPRALGLVHPGRRAP
nr:uncharacterized protein LOC104652215 [Saimiri boliviensis boliviensis]